MDRINQLSMPEKLITGGGILMLIASFFAWFKYSASGEIAGVTFSNSVSRSGWGAPGSIWSLLAILIAVVLAGVIIATKFGNMRMPDLPAGWTWGLVFGGGAAAIVVLMLLKAWRISNLPVGGFGIGFFLAVIATIAIAAGGYMMYQQERSGSVRM